MRTLLFSDLHLTDNPKDEYRWEIFLWLENILDKYLIDRAICLGDLTDRKNHHSDKLVNRVVDNLKRLDFICNLSILKGNHDYEATKEIPFFKFLRDGGIDFYLEPTKIKNELFLPHTRNPQKDWKNLDLKGVDTIYTHQLVLGVKFSNGYRLQEGVNTSFFKGKKIYSGDLHDSQKVGDVHYIGAPYSINYGDHYDGKVLILDEDKEIELYPEFLKKWNVIIKDIKDLDKFKFKEGDRIKVKYELFPYDFPLWVDIRKEIKSICKRKKISLDSTEVRVIKNSSVRKRLRRSVSNTDKQISHSEILENFVKKENLGKKHLEIGLELL